MRLIFILIPIFLFSSIIKYLNLKPFYYKNQIVNLKIKIISTEKNLSFFSPNVNMEINHSNPYIYILSTHFQANNTPKNIFIFPTKELINLNKVIKLKPIPQPPKNFSNLIAKNIKIFNIIATQSNNKIILSFSIKCKECNLKDFHLKEINSSLIKKNEGTFLAYLPLNRKKFEFYYFNLKENTFKKVSIPIITKEEKISTQTDINPNENTFLTPLNIILIAISIFTFLLFFVYKKIFIIFLSFIPLIPIAIQVLPKGEIILKKDTNLTILPTENSTIIYTTKQPTKAIILKKINGYLKVKIKNKIGWVKNENN